VAFLTQGTEAKGLTPVRRQAVTVQRARPTKALAKPETGYDITGFYRVGSYTTTLQINSAGKHFVGWMQVRGKKRFETSKLKGDLDFTPNLTLEGTYTRERWGVQTTGTIKIHSQSVGGSRLELHEQGWRGVFYRDRERARLSESAISEFPNLGVSQGDAGSGESQ
jgi:hypothetical protein